MSRLEHPGLVFRSLDPSEGDEALLKGWYEATRRGFHQTRGNDDGFAAWRAHTQNDSLTLLGAWSEATEFASATMPVATFSSWTAPVNVGGGTSLPTRLISDVTVAPTHRRQGLLRKLMTVALADAVAEGLPLAALTVSEGSIYGRFGFGMATHVRQVEVEVTSKFRFRDDAITDDGSVTLLEPADAWKTIASVYATFQETTRGSVTRPHYYETWLSSAYDFGGDSKDESKQRVALHLDASGTPDGYVVFKTADERNDAGLRMATVVDLVALTPAAYLRLWRFLADIDLVERVSWRKAPLRDPLSWALAEPFVVKSEELDDFLWMRVLDPVAALQARPWHADGEIVLGVDDQLGHASGAWQVVVRDGRAEVTATDARPSVTLSADTLGALYLGGVDVRTLAAAGRVTGSTEAIETWAAMADGGPLPYCITGF
ncbi:putative acetyltransferase [Nocardioides albertanoniae]|uniref:Putative acetyltransferase n=1 Tax=Nocardioides albertanoniae TaxID=1175486 RepID=A0A543A3P4_9ACTN|nr:GNAT family N-acetyltransferase [Nocardioides albertanoniae]TQL67199.1 putative acetyltransferase [Nocardioides albertanoniae]